MAKNKTTTTHHGATTSTGGWTTMAKNKTTTTKDTRLPVRQGDVLCIPVKAIPESARAKKLPADKDVILAFGEVTGHAHRIKERQLVGFEGDVPGAAAWLEIAAPVSLTHEEHTSHTLPSGAWKINIHREYSPEEIRNVAD